MGALPYGATRRSYFAFEKIFVVKKINLQPGAGQRSNFDDERVIVVVNNDVHAGKADDFVEAVAAYDCPPDPEAGWGFCMYCAADTESEPHAPNCAYRRARELCGKDGAS